VVTTIRVALSRRLLVQTAGGRRTWQTERVDKYLRPSATAVVICDVWDRHWSRGATERVDEVAPKIDAFCRPLRSAGVLIAHAPSETMSAYVGTPARARAQGLDNPLFPARTHVPEAPPMPFEIESGGSDTEDDVPPGTPVWSRQHAAIEIDQSRDVISDDGEELAAYFDMTGRRTVLMTGVHTNLCILNRSFGLRALVSRGFEAILVADLTDAMYDPAQPPYVSHEEGTALIVHYVEAFIAPATTVADIVLT
jgi:nicotinamidase-related amidase